MGVKRCTNEDRARELKAIVKIADASKMNASLDGEDFSRSDFSLWRKGDRHKRIVAVGEIKGVLRYPAAEYPFPTLVVDKAKVDALEERARLANAIPVVFFYFDECGTIFSVRGPFDRFKTRVIERKDRGDRLDRDLIVDITFGECKRIP